MVDRHQPGHESTPEFRLSRESARRIADSTPAPRPRRTFLSTDHLSTEAAAAYVDGRLPTAGLNRAYAHLQLCEQCRLEIDDQREARRALRGSGPIRMPNELRDRLRLLEAGAHDDENRPSGAQEPASGSGRPAGSRPDDSGPDSPWSRLLRRLRRPGH